MPWRKGAVTRGDSARGHRSVLSSSLEELRLHWIKRHGPHTHSWMVSARDFMFLLYFWPARPLLVPTVLPSRKLEADLSFSELILNETKTQVIMFGSLRRQQALSASLMINTAAGNVLQLVDQFNDARIWLHTPPALTNAEISSPHSGSRLVLGGYLIH